MRLASVLFAVIMLISVPAAAQPPFHLAGDWKGEIISTHNTQEGLAKGESCLFSIKEEHDGVFFGSRIWHEGSRRHSVEFAGAINPANQSLHIVEGNENIFLGSVNTPNEIELHQLHLGGSPGAARYLLHRAD